MGHPRGVLLGSGSPRRGSFGEADTGYRQALDLSRKVYEPGHQRIAEVLTGYGRFLVERRRESEAESLLRAALASRSESFGAEDWRTAEAELKPSARRLASRLANRPML